MSDVMVGMEEYRAAASYLQARMAVSPTVGIVLGSGLGALAEAVEDAVAIPFGEIPHWPVSTVQGHSGRMVVGRLAGVPVAVMQGRAHLYEGYSGAQLALPVRVMALLGIKTLIVTNAAGGINPAFVPGDVMVITDHINLPGMAGRNPLMGPNLDAFGPRFPDMGNAYDRELRALALEVAAQTGIVVQQGVYVAVSGPTFETPAEIRFLHTIGADAVGMSTAPEVAVARHAGLKVLGFSGISNKANLDGLTETTHDEVLEAGRVIAPKLATIIRGVLARLV